MFSLKLWILLQFTAVSYGCADEWMIWDVGGVCYVFFDDLNTRQTFSHANRTCHSVDSNLLTLFSSDEWYFLNSSGQINISSFYWLGLQQEPVPSSANVSLTPGWRWVDGSKITWENWNQDDGENITGCVIVDSDGTWHHQPCDSSAGFICKKYLSVHSNTAKWSNVGYTTEALSPTVSYENSKSVTQDSTLLDIRTTQAHCEDRLLNTNRSQTDQSRVLAASITLVFVIATIILLVIIGRYEFKKKQYRRRKSGSFPKQIKSESKDRLQPQESAIAHTYASSLPVPQKRSNQKQKIRKKRFSADYYNDPDIFPY